MAEIGAGGLPVTGVRLGVAAAGIRRKDRDDLLVIELSPGSHCAAVFTRNAFCAAPVTLARQHLLRAESRYLLINAGNANAGTGAQGLADAVACCRALAELVGCQAVEVLPFSTGVIGENLPVDRIRGALPDALSALAPDAWERASRAVMTTDTRPKLVSCQIFLGESRVTITGMAKGAGMIRPDMATMLAFVMTDLAVDKSLLQACLGDAVAVTFNAITVDGDTSTNDACVLAATGESTAPSLCSTQDPRYGLFAAAVTDVCGALAKAIVRDGEGATKFVEVSVEQAADTQEASRVAYTVAESPLVKTALFASDPNWGRILAAVGRAGIEHLDIDKVEIWIDDLCIVRGGGRAPQYTESAGQTLMRLPDLTIRICLGRGEHTARVFTCDLSYDYVRINAEYRT